MILNQANQVKQIISGLSLLLLLVIACPMSIADETEKKESYLSYRSKLDDLKGKKTGIRERVNSAKKKEKLALARLQSTQKELHKHQRAYISAQKRIQNISKEMTNAKDLEVKLQQEAQEQSKALKVHLHKLYIKKSSIASAFLEALLDSNSITDFLNTLYYQKRMISSEMALIRAVRDKQRSLKSLKTNLVSQKVQLEQSKQKSASLKEQVFRKKQEQYEMVNRLRKERLAYESAERQLEQQANQLTSKIIKLTDAGQLDLSDLVNHHYIYPCSARVTSGYGYRRHPIFRVRSFHSGIDLGARYKTRVKASNGGIVIYSGWYSGYGRTIIVSHGNHKSTLYAHLHSSSVKRGDKVAQGDTVGHVGSTGYATGPHLHFEYRVNGKHANPMQIL